MTWTKLKATSVPLKTIFGNDAHLIAVGYRYYQTAGPKKETTCQIISLPAGQFKEGETACSALCRSYRFYGSPAGHQVLPSFLILIYRWQRDTAISIINLWQIAASVKKFDATVPELWCCSSYAFPLPCFTMSF